MAKVKYHKIYKPGFVQSELTRIASAPQQYLSSSDLRGAIGMLAAAMLILLERSEKKSRKPTVANRQEKP